MRHFSLLLLLVCTVSSAAPLGAVPKIDPIARRVARTGLTSASNLRRIYDSAPVVVELRRPADQEILKALESAGLVIDRVDGRPTLYRHFVAAHASDQALDALSTLDFVVRVHSAPASQSPPLNRAGELTRLADARGARPALDLLTGAGITIGDIDTLVDVFAPAFFRGDAGYYDWIDVNQDGVFTPDVDAIDLDRDGVVGTTETAYALRAATYDAFRFNAIPARPDGWDPGLDWVYLDLDANQRRDYGPPMFAESTPAFGEPLLTPDDLNRNGKIDPGERFVRLGTSKFKKVQINLDVVAKLDRVFTRGDDLSQTPVDLTDGQLYGYADALHATGVFTILAGDLPLAGRKWVGVAPDADLLAGFYADRRGQLPVPTAMWMIEEGADVVLYEMAPWNGVPLDGTDPMSKIIDESAANDQVTHVCPTGDQGAARKHARAEVAANETVELPWDLPARAKLGAGPLRAIQLNVHLRGGDASRITLVAPDGFELPLLAAAQGNNGPGNASYYTVSQKTERDTYYYDAVLTVVGKTGATLPVGTWQLRIEAGALPLSANTYLADDRSGWTVGASWDPSVAREDHVIGVPSTADHCIAVGAMAGHTASDGKLYELDYRTYDVPDGFTEGPYQARAYSPIGPRIDGTMKPDVLAPDNPWVANTHRLGKPSSKTAPFGSYSLFGGTSGAAPFVAGAAALLTQAGVRGDAVRDAIRDGAFTNTAMGPLPNPTYGFGALDIAAALGAKESGIEPTVTLSFSPSMPRADQAVTLSVVASGGGQLEMKWDDDYDGFWDTPYTAIGERTVKASDKAQTKRMFKVRVRNASGRFAEAVVVVPFAPAAEGCGCDTTFHRGSEPLASLFVALLLLGALRLRWVRS